MPVDVRPAAIVGIHLKCAQAVTFYFSPYEGLKKHPNLVIQNKSSIISYVLNILGRFSDCQFYRASSTKYTLFITLIRHAAQLTITYYSR